jgi:hypothetical protein
MEHIREKDIPVLLTNITKHLNGFFICSVHPQQSLWHQVHEGGVKDEPWWREIFEKHHLVIRDDILKKYFPSPITRVRNEPTSWYICCSYNPS